MGRSVTAEVRHPARFSCLAAPEKWHQPTPTHVQCSLISRLPGFLAWKASNSIFITSPGDIYWALHPLTFKCEMRYRPWVVFSLKMLHCYFCPRKEIKRNIRCTNGLRVGTARGHSMHYSSLNVSYLYLLTVLETFTNFLVISLPSKAKTGDKQQLFQSPILCWKRSAEEWSALQLNSNPARDIWSLKSFLLPSSRPP